MHASNNLRGVRWMILFISMSVKEIAAISVNEMLQCDLLYFTLSLPRKAHSMLTLHANLQVDASAHHVTKTATPTPTAAVPSAAHLKTQQPLASVPQAKNDGKKKVCGLNRSRCEQDL